MATKLPFGIGDVIRIALICLAVGFVIHTLGFGPWDFWVWVGDAVDWVGRNISTVLRRFVEYIAIGAAVVLPIMLLMYLWRRLRRP